MPASSHKSSDSKSEAGRLTVKVLEKLKTDEI